MTESNRHFILADIISMKARLNSDRCHLAQVIETLKGRLKSIDELECRLNLTQKIIIDEERE